MTSFNAGENVVVRCVSVQQPIGDFYVGAMAASDLVAISWADVRRIAPQEEQPSVVVDEIEVPPRIDDEQDDAEPIEPLDDDIVRYEDQGFEEFLGIQRQLNSTRVTELRQYVQNVDATFPTAILLAVSSEHASFNKCTNELSIVRHSKVAKIIDGQHRIAGLSQLGDTTFQVNVAIFIDMDIQDQAMVFATINLKQTKVNKSLAYDLYQFTTSRSPQRSCHDIVRFLDGRPGSPFQGKVKMLGVALEPTETITQATFVDRLLRLISRNPMADRDLLKRKKGLDRARGAQRSRQIFRDFFIDDQDHIIALDLWNFFLAVQTKWPNSWQTVEQGNILNRTAGFGALMRFMRVAYLSLDMPKEIVQPDTFSRIITNINIADGTFTPDIYVPGSSGEKKLFDELVEKSQLQDFR